MSVYCYIGDGDMLNLSLVKLIREDRDGGWFAYFTLPREGEPWERAERIYIPMGDIDDVRRKLRLEMP